MELVGPPPTDGPRQDPKQFTLPADTLLYRVHKRDYWPDAFNARPEEVHFLGSRFGGTAEDRYPCLYAGLSPAIAIVETLLHDARFGSSSLRTLPRAFVGQYVLSTLRLTSDVHLVSLQGGPALAAVANDGWLVHCDRDSYPMTRTWGHWIRSHADWAKGFIWWSRRDDGSSALVLFGDRLGEPARVDHRPVVVPSGADPVDFAKPEGITLLNQVLVDYQTAVMDEE